MNNWKTKYVTMAKNYHDLLKIQLWFHKLMSPYFTKKKMQQINKRKLKIFLTLLHLEMSTRRLFAVKYNGDV